MLLFFHIVFCVVLVLIVLLQAGKSGGFGTGFGGGGSQSLFGSSGAGNFLTKTTAILAALFFMTSLTLTIRTTMESRESVVKDEHVEQQDQTQPSQSEDKPSSE